MSCTHTARGHAPRLRGARIETGELGLADGGEPLDTLPDDGEQGLKLEKLDPSATLWEDTLPGLAPAFDPLPGRRLSCPVFWWRQISVVFGSH